MTGKEQLALIAEQRSSRAKEILANPRAFKVCEGCSSLFYDRPDREGKCIFCHAYRFDKDVNRIIELARLLGDRPIAFCCPVLPRSVTPKGLTAA
jgi:hypothetical protein